VAVGVAVAVCVGVSVGVRVGVAVGVAVGVLDGVKVDVLVGVAVGVGVDEGVLDGVLEGVKVGVLVAVELGVDVGVRVRVLVGVAVPTPPGSQMLEALQTPPTMRASHAPVPQPLARQVFPVAGQLQQSASTWPTPRIGASTRQIAIFPSDAFSMKKGKKLRGAKRREPAGFGEWMEFGAGKPMRSSEATSMPEPRPGCSLSGPCQTVTDCQLSSDCDKSRLSESSFATRRLARQGPCCFARLRSVAEAEPARDDRRVATIALPKTRNE